jgi:hypothetical protein
MTAPLIQTTQFGTSQIHQLRWFLFLWCESFDAAPPPAPVFAAPAVAVAAAPAVE